MSSQPDIIRRTGSICHKCLNPLEAFVVERNGKIIFEKNCSTHGPLKITLSEHPWYYRQSSEFFFKVMNNNLPQDSYHLYLTDKCNLSCPICITESGDNVNIEDLDIDSFKNILNNNRKIRFILFGGEPTCNDKLSKIIRLMKKNNQLVMMCTNGVKLADFNYLKELVSCGLDRIDLQFDGFEKQVYKVIRGADLIDLKLKALDNLKKIRLPTGLSMLIVKGLNENQIKPVLDYAAKNHFIKNVSFIALTFMGGAFNFPLENYMFPDQIVDLVQERTQGLIRRDKLLIFQKVFNAYSSFIKKRRCFYYQSYALVRYKDSYKSIGEIFDFNKMNHELESYAKYCKKNKLLAGLYLFKGFAKVGFFALFKPLGLLLIVDLIKIIFSYASAMGNYNQSKYLLNIIFTTACDLYKMDKTVGEYCHRGIYYSKENKIQSSKFRFDYNIDLEKTRRK